MALSVATNVGALSATKAASSVNKSMETSMARLASGKRINSAADDSAGLAIASRLTAEARGLDMAARNAADAQAMLTPSRALTTRSLTSCSVCVNWQFRVRTTPTAQRSHQHQKGA